MGLAQINISRSGVPALGVAVEYQPHVAMSCGRNGDDHKVQ